MSPVCLSFALVEETRVTSKSAAALLYLGETMEVKVTIKLTELNTIL